MLLAVLLQVCVAPSLPHPGWQQSRVAALALLKPWPLWQHNQQPSCPKVVMHPPQNPARLCSCRSLAAASGLKHSGSTTSSPCAPMLPPCCQAPPTNPSTQPCRLCSCRSVPQPRARVAPAAAPAAAPASVRALRRAPRAAAAAAAACSRTQPAATCRVLQPPAAVLGGSASGRSSRCPSCRPSSCCSRWPSLLRWADACCPPVLAVLSDCMLRRVFWAKDSGGHPV